jgi:hypothetical protein
MAKQSNNSLKAGGPAGERHRKTGHALGEDEPITLLVSTPPAPEAGMNNDRRSFERIDPGAFASRCCGVIWTVRRIPGRRSAAGCPP